MENCPLCGGEISDKRNVQISKTIMAFRSALLTDPDEGEIRSAVSSSVEVMDIPLSLNTSKELSFSEKEKKLIKSADGTSVIEFLPEKTS